MIFGLVNVIWFTAIVCLFAYIFSKGNGFEANFEQILKDLKRIWAGGNGIQWNISLSQRFKILFNRPRRTQIYYCYMINTVSHDVLVWIQGRNIFFMANRTQPQELITQKCSCYGQVDLQTDFGTNFQPANLTDLKKTFIDLLNNF